MKIPNTSLLAQTAILSILSLAGLMFLAPTILHAASADGGSSKTPTFSNHELAGNPFTTDVRVGTTCPNTPRTCPRAKTEATRGFSTQPEPVFQLMTGSGSLPMELTRYACHTMLSRPQTIFSSLAAWTVGRVSHRQETRLTRPTWLSSLGSTTLSA